jgi:hypothetical protein
MRARSALATPFALLLLPAALQAQVPRVAAACAAPEYRQLDFWLGDWDAYDVDDATQVAARVQVEPVVDGCSLHEIYRGSNGLVGESFSIYDASRRVWHQTWVTNRGQLLTIEGGWRGDHMLLEGGIIAGERIRAVWKPEGSGVRETAERSTDGGKSWKPLFDMAFRAHK